MIKPLRLLTTIPLALWIGAAALVPGSRANSEPKLRPLVEVTAAEVRLGDLFINAGVLANQPVLAAPAPGEEYYLTLAQIFDLANARGLAWRPVAPFETITVRRAWRYLDPADIRAQLTEALYAAGAPAPLTVELPLNALELKVGRGTVAEIAFQDTVYKQATDRYHTTLMIQSADGAQQRYTLSGTAFAEVDVPVLGARLRPDQVIRDGDIKWLTVRRSRLPVNAVTDPDQLIGKSPKRTLTPGRIVTADNIGEPIVVPRGTTVAMHLVSRNMHLVATGRALAAGAMGDIIQVQNTSSRIAVDAVVTGPGRVEVRTGAILASR